MSSYLTLNLRYIYKQNTRKYTQIGAENALFQFFLTITEPFSPVTIRKVIGGGEGKKTKKNSGKGKCQEKKFMQRRRQRKKFMQKEGPRKVVTFSESLSFRNQQYYQAQYE